MAGRVSAGAGNLRNIFDQYSQPENRVTHALLCALNEDRRLLSLFLRELVRTKPPVDARKLSVLEQQYPARTSRAKKNLTGAASQTAGYSPRKKRGAC
jgi:hypothetical protein